MFVLVNNQVRPEVDYTSVQISQTANDPMTTASFSLTDVGSIINVSEFQEAIILDNDAFPNQTINLLQNPLLNPIATNWTSTAHSGCAYAQGSPNGLNVTLTNVAVATQPVRFQNTQVGLTAIGQTYTASCVVTGTSIVAAQASITISFLDATATSTLITQTSTAVTPTGSPQTISVSLLAPAGAYYIQVYLNVVPTNATNSGVITFNNAQLEPQLFSAYGTKYPTPPCDKTQTNCVLLPNGTTCRQQRLFAGFITHLLYDTFAGPNRMIHVDCSGPAFILETAIDFETYTNKSDSFIISALLAELNPLGVLSTNHVQTLVTFDTFTIANDTMRTAIDNLCSLTGARWFVDPYYDIWYLLPGFYAHAFSLSDNPDNVTTFSYAKYAREVDFTQPCNSAYVPVGNGGNTAHVREGASIARYNREFQRKVSASQSITTNSMGYQRGLAEVIQYAYGRTIIHIEVDDRRAQPITVGNTILLTNSIDEI